MALFSAGGGTSGEWAPVFARQGAVVIDNSSRWRMNDDVPLVVSEVNPHALDSHNGIIANPNCSTMQMVVALAPLHREAGIERLVISHLPGRLRDRQAGRGRAAGPVPRAAPRRSRSSPPTRTPTRSPSTPSPTPAPSREGDDHTDEERKLINETRKILEDPSIRVSATCVRVPVVNGHSEAVNVQTREELSPERARELLERPPG